MAKDITTTYSVWNFNFSDDMAQDLLRAGNELPEESSVEIALPRFTPGIARSHTIKNKVSILAELNFEITTDGRRYTLVNGDLFSIDPDFGLEATYSNIIFLRAGIGNFQKIKNDFGDQTSLTFQPNIGVGLKFMNLYVDYAFTDVGDQSIALYSHVFSLKLDMYKEPIR